MFDKIKIPKLQISDITYMQVTMHCFQMRGRVSVFGIPPHIISQ